jgi:hypothetical protein
MAIEGTGMTVSFGDLSMNLNDVDMETDFYSTDKPMPCPLFSELSPESTLWKRSKIIF